MQQIDKNCRFTVHQNELWAGFLDWVVKIKSEFVGNGNLLRWSVTFGKGDPGPYAHPIYCKTLEDAFELINEYQEQYTYDRLMDKLAKDFDIDNKNVITYKSNTEDL